MQLTSTGREESFTTGSVRDDGTNKPRPDLRSPFAAERCGRWMALGAQRYKERNWELGQNFNRVIASLCRHVMQYQQGDTESGDDHLAAIVFNAEALMHYEEMIHRGVLPASLDDRPCYKAQPALDAWATSLDPAHLTEPTATALEESQEIDCGN